MKTVIISHEDWTNMPRTVEGKGSPTLIANLLKEIFLDGMGDLIEPKILITVRRQGDLLPSYFAQTVNRAKFLKELQYYKKDTDYFEAYINYIFNDLYRINFFDYNNVVSAYQEAFGSDAVQVAPMEGLFNLSSESHVRYRLANFIGVEVNAIEESLKQAKRSNQRAYNNNYRTMQGSFSSHGKALSLVWNRTKYFLSPIQKASWVIGVKEVIKKALTQNVVLNFEVTNERKKEITAMFTDSNRILAERQGLDLKCYGYFPTADNSENYR